jgi:hypothetical protein
VIDKRVELHLGPNATTAVNFEQSSLFRPEFRHDAASALPHVQILAASCQSCLALMSLSDDIQNIDP